MIKVKICGLTTAEDARAVARAGADYIGLNFYPPASRAISIDKAAAILAAIPPGVTRVALLVDPDDALVDRVIDPGFDLIQLHGQETPDRVAAIRARAGLPVMKVIGVRNSADVDLIPRYVDVADQILIDAKAPKDSAIPGGHGVPFDWSLLAGRTWDIPWMLAGGLTPANVARAIELTGAAQVDVASGVESSPGRKDLAKVRAFIDAARATQP